MLININSNFNRKVWVFIVSAIVLDLLLGLAQVNIVYPMVGLFLVSVLCGPWAGAVTGLLSSIIIGVFFFLVFPESRDNTISPFFPWWLLYFFMGYFAGKMSQWGYFKSWWLSILTGFLTAVSTTALYIAISGLFFANNPYPDFLEIIGKFLGTAMNGFNSLDTAFPVFPITISALLTFFLIKSPLNKFFVGLPQIDNIATSLKSNSTATQKTLGLATLAIVILWIIFVIWIATALSAAVN